MSTTEGGLSFTFRDRKVPVTHASSITPEVAQLALESEVFRDWSNRCGKENEGKRIEVHSVELQSVDMFGSR
jgi:hypothetical protein